MHKYLKYYFIIGFIIINELLFSQVSFNIRNSDTNESRMKLDLQSPSLKFNDSIQSFKSKFDNLNKQNSISLSNTLGHKLLAQELRQTWNGINWQNNYKYIYYYDSFDNITEWVFQSYNYYEPTNIDYQRKEINTYDGNGNLVVKIRQLKDVQDWYNISRSFYKYDVNNYLILDSLEFWDSLSNWKPSSRTFYSYDQNNNLTEILELIRVSGNYSNGSRWVYQYDDKNNRLEEKYQLWDSQDWVPFYIRTYLYDNLNNNVELILQEWNIDKLSYTNRYSYAYDDNRNQTEVTSLEWLDSVWVTKTKRNSIYSSNNLLTEISDYYWNNAEWWLSSKEFYSYDKNGNNLEILSQYVSGMNFLNSTRITNNYDLENNLLSSEAQIWDGSNWINSLKTFRIYVPKPGFNDNVNNYWLANNYPNPFNNSTTIRFLIPKEEIVALKIFNILGQEVQVLINNDLKLEGVQEILWDVSKFSSGVYFYQIKAGEFVETKKMTVVK